MASTDEIVRLILEADAKGVTETQAKITALDAELKQLSADYQAGTVSRDEYINRGSRLQADLDQTRMAFDKAEAAIKKYGSAQAAAAELQKQASASYSLLQQRITGASYALNDFFGVSGDLSQRFNAIANNLPMLLAGFGNIGLALSGLVPIIALVIKNWEGIAETFGFSAAKVKDQIGVLEDRIKELSEKKIKLGADTLELEAARDVLKQIREGIEAFEQAKGLKSSAEQQSGAAVKGILAEAPGGAEGLMGALKAGLIPEMEKFDDILHRARQEVAAATANFEAMKRAKEEAFETGDAEQMAVAIADVEAAQKRVNAAESVAVTARSAISMEHGKAEQVAGDLLKRAQEGDAGAQAQLAARLEKAGRGDVAEKIKKSSPAAAADMKQAEAEIEVGKKRAAERDKQIDEEGDLFRRKAAMDREVELRRQEVAIGGMGFLPEAGAGRRVEHGPGRADAPPGIGEGIGQGGGVGVVGVPRGPMRSGMAAPAPRVLRIGETRDDRTGRPDVTNKFAGLNRAQLARAKRAAKVKATKEAKQKRAQRIMVANANKRKASLALGGSTVGAAAAGPRPGQSPLEAVRPMVDLGTKQLDVTARTSQAQAQMLQAVANLNAKVDLIANFQRQVGGQIQMLNQATHPRTTQTMLSRGHM